MNEFYKFALLASLSLGAVFLAVGLISFLPLYIINSQADRGYVQGNCTYEKGYVQASSCGESIWRENCWFGMVGLSAIRNVTCYIGYGPYKTQIEAREAIDYTSGSNFGLCYYRKNGTEITISLKNYETDLIVFIFLVIIGSVIIIFGVAFYFFSMRKKVMYRSLNDFKPGDIV